MPTRNDQLLSTPVRKLELLDIRPSELAQQLSLMEHDLCKGIQLADFENRRNNAGPYTDTIVPSIRFSNNVRSPRCYPQNRGY